MSPRCRLSFLLALSAALAACSGQDRGDYPQLLPLSQLNQPPAVPAHAADAAADPQAVGAALKARRAEAAARTAAAGAPVTDAAALGRRAEDLQRRAGALARAQMSETAGQGEPPGQGTPSPVTPSPVPANPAPSGPAGPGAGKDDPVTAARAEALRERARALSARPVTDAPRPSPATPACAPDPTSCNP